MIRRACRWVAVLLTALVLAAPAAAADQPKQVRGWRATPYFQPILSGGGVLVNGQQVIQTQAGGDAGVTYRYRKPRPHWYGRSRVRAVGIYATTGSLGADVRVGSFFGPDWKVVQLQHGPDVWFDVYGSRTGSDYHLPPTFGVDFLNQLLVRLTPELGWMTAAAPGWVTNRTRRVPDLGPFHTFYVSTALILKTEYATFQVGVRRQWTSAGPVNGLILSGSL